MSFGFFSRVSAAIFSPILERTMASRCSSSHSNRLSLEKSPYLLQHATNPVDWYPWGDEAFEAARKENKLIFLSVGYSTCHWCHVMERESFENPEIAKIMNEHFISVKVDREERPDVDKVYMTFVTKSSGHGGWPMSVFLTPDLVPVSGGTYFPPEDKYGRPGFATTLKALASKSISGGGGWPMSVWLTPELKPVYGGTYYPPDDRYYGQPGFGTLLTSIASQWKESRAKFEESGAKIMEVLKRTTVLTAREESGLPSEGTFAKAYSQLDMMYEPDYGGFGDAPKFPQPSNFNFLFAYQAIYHQLANAKKGVDMALHTLKMMDRGGIHDHISQGFARYSTDKQWHVPHFEKMLYDQAQLLMTYIDAYLYTKNERHAEVARDIMTYVMRDLSHPKGGFYSAEDADSYPTATSEKKREGAFCVWTHKEIFDLLSESIKEGTNTKLAQVFSSHYDVREGGNVDPYQDPHDELKKQNVLICPGTVEDTATKFGLSVSECEDILEKCRKILYDARQKRPRPHLDDKMLTAWNGMMMGAAARAGSVLCENMYVERAIQNAEFIKAYLWKDKELMRAAYKGDDDNVSLGSEIRGFSDDYAWLVRGLFHLYNATLNEDWLRWAEELQDCQNDLFWDAEGGGGYFLGRKEDQTILLRLKDDHDGAEPSVNSVSAGNLVRLSRLLNRPDYDEKAKTIFSLFAVRLEKMPVSLPEMTTALMLYKHPAEQVILAGDRNSPQVKEMLDAVHTSNHNPNRIILLADTKPDDSLLYARNDCLKNYIPKDSEELAYLCRDFTCLLPVKTPNLLKEKMISGFRDE